jgi:hypothetical protein
VRRGGYQQKDIKIKRISHGTEPNEGGATFRPLVV